MPLQKDFIKDDPKDLTPQGKNKRLSSALSAEPYLSKGIMLIERVEEGETGWMVYFRG